MKRVITRLEVVETCKNVVKDVITRSVEGSGVRRRAVVGSVRNV